MTDKTVQFKPRSYRTEIVSTDGTVLVSRHVIATSYAHAAARSWDMSEGLGVFDRLSHKVDALTVNVTPEEE